MSDEPELCGVEWGASGIVCGGERGHEDDHRARESTLRGRGIGRLL